MSISFGGWPDELHETPDQQKRIASARKAETTPSTIDRETQTGEFPGSGKNPYRTSLTRCTCQFFHAKGVPCKHMYRLAMELGIIDIDYKTGTNKNDGSVQQIGWKAALGKIRELPIDDQRIVKNFLYSNYYAGEPEIWYEPSEEIDRICETGLFSIRPVDPVDVFRRTLDRMKKAELVAYFDAQGAEYNFRRMSDAVDWATENLPADGMPEYVALAAAPMFQQARRSVYSKLKETFDEIDFVLF